MSKDAFDIPLKVARVVDDVPTVKKGSKIDQLPQYQDAAAIIMKVKQVPQAPAKRWEIFDKQEAINANTDLKKFKTLVTAFATKVRALIEAQGVGKKIKLEQRKDKFYLVGQG